MPVPQMTPPGALDQHGLLVALTPVLLCAVAALAAAVIGERPGRSAYALRLLIALNLVGALLIQGLFLLPWGPAAAYTEPLAGGLVRVGWLPTTTAFALGLWSAWRWRPWGSGPGVGSLGWSLRTALGLSLPVVALPALAIAALADVREADARHHDGGRRWLAAGLAIVASAVIVCPLGMPHQVRWLIASATLLVMARAASTAWRMPLLFAAAAMAWPR
jgi:hypothetical protein